MREPDHHLPKGQKPFPPPESSPRYPHQIFFLILLLGETQDRRTREPDLGPTASENKDTGCRTSLLKLNLISTDPGPICSSPATLPLFRVVA